MSRLPFSSWSTSTTPRSGFGDSEDVTFPLGRRNPIRGEKVKAIPLGRKTPLGEKVKAIPLGRKTPLGKETQKHGLYLGNDGRNLEGVQRR